MPTMSLRLIRSFLILITFVGAVIIGPASSHARYLTEDAQPESAVDADTLFLPFVLKPGIPAAPLVPQTLFGVQMYGDTRATSPYFDSLKDSQASWYRNEISWSAVEPVNTDPNQFRWGHVDHVVGAATDGGINMVLTIGYVPNWAADVPGRPNGPIDPIYMGEFAEFVQALVERYDGDGFADIPGGTKVTHFEFFNEPDRVPEGGARSGWGEEPEAYAQMLSFVYPAVKAANPGAQVLFGGIAYDWFVDQGGPYVSEFLDGVLQEGGGAYFDIMNFHGYPPFAANWAPQGPGIYEKTVAIQNKLLQYGLQKPFFITESGMHSNNDVGLPLTEELQARYVVQLYTEGVAANVQTLIWFMLYDPPDWYPFKNGLVTAEESPKNKLAFDAYRVAVRMMEDMRSFGVLSAAETGNAKMQAYRLRNDAALHTLYVAWMNPVDSSETANLRILASRATVSDIYGNEKIISDGDDGSTDNHVTVGVSAQPVYVSVEE